MGCGSSKLDDGEKPTVDEAPSAVVMTESSLAPIKVSSGPLSEADLAKRLIGSMSYLYHMSLD